MATIEQIKELRDMTGAGVNAVREAIDTSNGDIEKAVIYLRQKGLAKSDKRKDKSALNGILGVYNHSNRVVVVVEVNCETDFAAKSADMLQFANDVALHIAASNPEYINADSIPAEIIAKEKEVYSKEVEGKPAEIQEKIMQGKLDKFYQEKTLVKQKFFLDDSKTIEDYLNELIAKIGEKIVISSFTKFEVAQDITSCSIK